MRRPSRIRRWFKWVGVIVCVLLLMMWVFSIWGGVSWSVGAWNVGLRAQELRFGWYGSDSWDTTMEWRIGWLREPNFAPGLPHVVVGNYFRMFLLPIWIPFLLVTVPTTFLFWRDHRHIPAGHCQKCGYNLTGNTSGVCPECGEKI
jgi:hypothetical protein